MSKSHALETGLAAPASPAAPPPVDIDPRIRAFLSGVTGVTGVPGGSSTGGNGVTGGGPAPSSQPAPQSSGGTGGGVRQAVRQQWLDAGYPPPAVDGIMRRVDVESGFNPRAIGDNGTSFGLYMHHGSRAVELANWAQNHGLNPADPVVQTKFAIAEMNGGDPIAAQSKPALMKATNSNQGYGAFTAGFQRPAGAPGSEETNLYRAAQGSFNGPAAALIQQWQSGMAQRGAEYDAALADAKDLHSASRAALAQWEAESNRPPQNMHAAWSQWAGLAGAIALFGGLFGRRSMTASLTAAGSMLQAANQADVQTYDQSYQQWKDHLDRGLKVIDLVNGEARDIVDDARKSYDQKLSELTTMSAAYQLEKQLDPESVENLTKNLQLLKDRRELIVAQNSDTELRNATAAKDAAWLKDHPEAGGEVPAEIHNFNVGAAKHDRSGIRAQTPQEAAFQQFIAEHPNATSEEMQSFFRSMHAPRSGIGMAMQQFIAEHPGASSQEISRFYANLQQEVGAGRAFAYGKQGDAIRSFSVALHSPGYDRKARRRTGKR